MQLKPEQGLAAEVDRITWKLAGTGIRLYCHKGPLASWQTVPQAQDDRAFQDRQGGKYET